jgi:IS605 OrfB family transposase
MGGQQSELAEFGTFEQPPLDERKTVARTVVFQIPTLTAKKSGLLNRAMKDYRRARAIACQQFQSGEYDPQQFNITDQNELSGHISGREDIKISRKQVAYAIRTVQQNYAEFAKDLRASPPEATRADTLAISRQGTRMFHEDERYYLNVRTGLDNVNLPLQTSEDAYHARFLSEPTAVPAKESKYQRRAGVSFDEIEPTDLPGRTQKISTSTLQKQGPRQFTANITFQVAKHQERTYDTGDARYVVGVDRGRNQLAYAALYDSGEDHVTDWFNRTGDEVEHYMNEFAERIKQFQEANVWEQMDDARQRRYRYKEQVDYEIANSIVDLAREADGSVVIALEDLEGMSKLGNYSVENRRFNEWSYYRLGQFIKQKADPYDIPVRRVNPRGTSQRCSRCGEDEETDRQGVYFYCQDCGYEPHADANAAVNTAKQFCQ